MYVLIFLMGGADGGGGGYSISSSSSIYYLTRGVPTGMALLQGTLGESL